MNEYIYAYAAGLFDGEGYVDIYQATKSKSSKNCSLMLRVIISQKDGLIMNWLKNNFGGNVLFSQRNDSYIYRWEIRSKAAEQFLNQIYPFAKIKKEQIELALKFQKTKGNYLNTLKGHQKFRSLSEQEMKERFEIKEMLKKIKKEYRPYNKTSSATETKRKDLPMGKM